MLDVNYRYKYTETRERATRIVDKYRNEGLCAEYRKVREDLFEVKSWEYPNNGFTFEDDDLSSNLDNFNDSFKPTTGFKFN